MAHETHKGSAGSAAAEITGKANEAAGDLASAANDLANTAADQFGDAGERVGDLYAKGATRAQETFDELPATLSDASVAGDRLIRQGRRRIDQGVRKQPVEALLLAGALGYLAGWATSRG